MKSLDEANSIVNEGDFLTAEELRNLTATKEELFEKKVFDIKENFMSTMVKLATQQGLFGYSAMFRKEKETSVLDKVKSEFEELGYTVTTTDRVQEIQGAEIEVTDLTVTWAAE